MDVNDKIRPIYLMKILKERTDGNHYLSTNELCDILSNEFHIDTYRTTIKGDIELLQKAGIGIHSIRSSQNLYSYIDREFEDYEIKLLIDAVESCKFITNDMCEELVSKIVSLAGTNKAREFKRNLIVDGRIKNKNDHIYFILDTLNDAINQKRKVRFQKKDYNNKKKLVLHNKGEQYIFSPYSLVWDGDLYYVVGYSEKHKSIGSHRLDRIADTPEILDEGITLPTDDFDINKYLNTMFHMYNAPIKQVELVCYNGVMNAVVDKFGADISVNSYDKDKFSVIVEVAVGTVFFNWVFGFDGAIRIKSPDEVKEQYKQKVISAIEFLDWI